MQKKIIVVNNVTIKPMTLFSSIWFFLISSILIYIGLYVFIPILLSKGIPFFIGYLIFFYYPFLLLFITALILYKKEGNARNVIDFKFRMRLNPLKKADWFWIIVIIFVSAAISGLLKPLINKIAKIPFFSPPDFFPAEINPNKTIIPGYMMDHNLSGEYWVIIAYFAGWFFNIFGEEFLWRGIIFPRQIKRYGSKAWIFHGIIWGLWHLFWKWNLIMLIPCALLLSYVVYKRKNTWIGIISHGLLNAIPLVMIIINVFK